MTEENCGNCRFWIEEENPIEGAERGECHRRTPDLKGWPVARGMDWCGEWEGKAVDIQCPHYWGSHALGCLLEAGHEGEHKYPLGESDMMRI